jgi:molybdopterin molybdotransferase
MIDLREAYKILFSVVKAGPTVELPLRGVLHRTLAAPVRSDIDYPPFDQSVMDGFAVRAADVTDAPVTLRIVGQIAAGAVPRGSVSPGETMQINTGAPIPRGADAVVCVEHTEAMPSNDEVLVREAVRPGEFITRRGAYVSVGQTVLMVGTKLTPVDIGAAASAGRARVQVYRRPTVAVLSTGDELIEIDRRPAGSQIRASNESMLEALVTAAHAEPVLLKSVGDRREAIRSGITEGLRSDVLCITGGVSMGAFDLVPDVLEECGCSLHIRKVAIKPGRPAVFASGPDGTPVFALPGNPASAFVAFELLVRPALAVVEGRRGAPPAMARATLRGSIKPTGDRRTYLPARARVEEDGQWVVERLSWQGSGDPFGIATADALIMRPPGAAAVAHGETVSVHLLDRS